MAGRPAIEYDADQVASTKEHVYYKKLQDQLRQQKQAKAETKNNQKERLDLEKDDKVHQTKKVETDVAAKKIFDIEDKVQLSKSSSKDNHKLKKEKKDGMHSSDHVSSKKDVALDGIKILKFLGFKIDMTSRMSDLVESFMRNTVQSRSHNFFLGKYAQFKVGVLGQLLSALGLTSEELHKLQKKALEGSIDENIKLMGENLYNLELTELVHGKKRKVRRSLAMFQEVEQQLIMQMRLLGNKGWWTPARLLEERIKQCKRIKEEFNRERAALLYQYEYIKQDKWKS
jgi:hypothetical protein